MACVIEHKIGCHNQVTIGNDTIMCGLYQIQGEQADIKVMWFCDECSESVHKTSEDKE